MLFAAAAAIPNAEGCWPANAENPPPAPAPPPPNGLAVVGAADAPKAVAGLINDDWPNAGAAAPVVDAFPNADTGCPNALVAGAG